MFQNVIEQLSGSKILRIAAHDFILVLGSIWQIDKVMQYIKQAFLSEQSAHHRDTFEFDFNGNGFVIWGNICCTRSITPDYINRVSTRHIGSEVFGLAEPNDPYVAKVEIWIDGELDHVAALPMRNTDRKVEPAWKYLMKEGRHHVKMKWLNRKKDYIIRINDIMYYSEKKEHDRFYFNK